MTRRGQRPKIGREINRTNAEKYNKKSRNESKDRLRSWPVLQAKWQGGTDPEEK